MNANDLKKRYADGDRDFTAADLSGASLSWINLSGANLSRTDLYGAQLSGANLSQANLSAANLSGADLSRADLSGANLEGADLQGANLNNTNLNAAVYNQLTKFPQGFEPGEVGMLNSEQLKEQAAQTAKPPVVLADRTTTPTEDLNQTVVDSLGTHQVYQTTPTPIFHFENSIPTPNVEPAVTGQVPFQNFTAYGSSNSTSTATNSKSSEDVKKAAIVGSVIGAAIIIGFLVTKSPQPSPTPTPTSNPNATPSSSTPSPSPPAPQPSSFTQQDAVNLINAWLEGKRVMFAPPYDRQKAEELTTGEQYQKTAGPEGTINWLQNNNAYYRYGVVKIDGIDEFVINGNRATIQVKVIEDRTLYKNGRVDPGQSDFKTRTVVYNLELVGGRWKIASSKIL